MNNGVLYERRALDIFSYDLSIWLWGGRKLCRQDDGLVTPKKQVSGEILSVVSQELKVACTEHRRIRHSSGNVKYNVDCPLFYCFQLLYMCLCARETVVPYWCALFNKGLANAKRPCDCRVLCLRLKSSLCSCAHSISDMTSFSCRNQGRDSVCPML